MPISAADSGSCGDSIKWTLSDGVLELKGSGEMTDYSFGNPAPWYEKRESVRSVKIGKGITSVGSLAFNECGNLSVLSLPEGLETIGSYAFNGCKMLVSISLPSSVKTISECAFNECENVFSVSIPDGLERVDAQAFCRCYKLAAVKLPASVKTMGVSVFSYCSSLIRAEIYAEIPSLPMWTFYGCSSLTEVVLPGSVSGVGELSFLRCDNLQIVYYPGSDDALEAIASGIAQDVQGFSASDISSESPKSNGLAGGAYVTEDGEQTYTKEHEYTLTENSTIITTETKELGSETDEGTKVKIDASVANKDGWQEVINTVKKESANNPGTEPLEVEIRADGNSTIPGNIIASLAGENINLSIVDNGYSVTIYCKDIDRENVPKKLDFSYILRANDEPSETQKKTIGDAESYILSFSSDIEFKFSTNIYINKNAAGKYASIYQKEPGKGLVLLQTALVDSNGYASFYFASVIKGTEYVIALNVEGVDFTNVIHPENDPATISAVNRLENPDYVVSGVRTFMGMTLGWFTLAVVGVIVFIGIIIAIIMLVFVRKKYIKPIEYE